MATATQTNYEKFNTLIRVVRSAGSITWTSHKWALSKFGTRAVSGSSYDGEYVGCIDRCVYSHKLGKTTDGNIVFPTLSLTLARGQDGQPGLGPDEVNDIRSYDYLIEYDLYVYHVSGTELPSASSLVFVGKIGRGDLKITQTQITIQCSDRMKFDNLPLLRQRYTNDSPVAVEWRGKPKPQLWGDWSGNDGEWQIECPVTHTDNSAYNLYGEICAYDGDDPREIGYSGGKYKWVDSGGQAKGGDYSHYDVEDYLPGDLNTFIKLDESKDSEILARAGASNDIDGSKSQTYRWKDGDRILLKGPHGYAYAGGGTAAIYNPAQIAYKLLTDSELGLGLGASAVNYASYATVNNYFLALLYHARNWVNDESKTVFDAIKELCYEFGFKIVVKNGLYYFYFLGWHDTDTSTYTDVEYSQINDWTESAGTSSDEFDGVEISYCKVPGGERKHKTEYAEPSLNTGNGVHQMNSNWIYDGQTANARMAVFRLTNCALLKKLHLEMDFTGLDISLCDTLRVNHDGDDYYYYFVTGVDVDYAKAEVTIDALALNDRGPYGVWSDDPGETCPDEWGGDTVPVDFTSASDDQKELLSFWADATGTTDPDGEEAKVWS